MSLVSFLLILIEVGSGVILTIFPFFKKIISIKANRKVITKPGKLFIAIAIIGITAGIIDKIEDDSDKKEFEKGLSAKYDTLYTALGKNGLRVDTSHNNINITVSNQSTFNQKFYSYVQLPTKILHDTLKVPVLNKELTPLIRKHIIHRIDSVLALTKIDKSKTEILITRMPDCKCKNFADELKLYFEKLRFKDVIFTSTIFPVYQEELSEQQEDNIAIMTSGNISQIEIIVGS